MLAKLLHIICSRVMNYGFCWQERFEPFPKWRYPPQPFPFLSCFVFDKSATDMKLTQKSCRKALKPLLEFFNHIFAQFSLSKKLLDCFPSFLYQASTSEKVENYAENEYEEAQNGKSGFQTSHNV